MKKIIALAVIAASFAACDTQDKKVTTTEGTDTTGAVTTVSTTYTPGEGDVMYKDGKVMVWRSDNWVEAEGDVTLENGIVVRRNGEVRRDDKVVVLHEGETVNRSGNFFDKTGAAIDNAWDATKKGVSKAADATEKGVNKAADAVKKAGKKVGEKTKEVVRDIKN